MFHNTNSTGTKSFKLQESLKVEMGLLEARLENSKRKLESELRSDFERQASREYC